MLITIKNDCLRLCVDTLGSQMMNLQSADGVEYLWQGDPKYWGDRSPLLFPFVGRLTNNSYQLHGKVYPMTIHGFAAALEFAVVETSEDHFVLELTDNEETRKQYPFAFALRVTYRIIGNVLKITYQVENRNSEIMPFGIGGHPGFRVPIVNGENFEDYSITFSHPNRPDRVGFTSAVYLNGHDESYPLVDDARIDLRHDLFDEDAIILKNMAKEVTLQSKISGRGVRVSYPDMPYLGIWHWPGTDAPYVCIEPWSSLPARQDVIEDFYCKSDMIHLASKKTYETTWAITIL